MREDFCGTFSVCCEWVKLGRQRTALGVDLDPEPLAWGEKHILSKLQPAQASRVRILEKDVREKTRPAADVLAAQNFSFWLFKTRKELLEYFRIARSNMSRQSIMVMDMMGGGDCYAENTVEKKVVKKGKKVKGKRVDGTPYLKQWRWRCTFRDAYYVCCLIWPFAHTKLPKIQKVIEHYTQQALKSNVISLDEYRMVQKDVR